MDIPWRRFTKAYKAIAILAIMATVGLACAPAASLQQPSTTAITTSINPSPPVSNSASSAPASVSSNDFTAAVRQVVQTVKPALVQIANEQVQAGQFNQRDANCEPANRRWQGSPSVPGHQLYPA